MQEAVCTKSCLTPLRACAASPSPSPGGPDPAGEVQAMKAKLQRAKRTLDNMKKREADALAQRDAALAQLAVAGAGVPSQVG